MTGLEEIRTGETPVPPPPLVDPAGPRLGPWLTLLCLVLLGYALVGKGCGVSRRAAGLHRRGPSGPRPGRVRPPRPVAAGADRPACVAAPGPGGVGLPAAPTPYFSDTGPTPSATPPSGATGPSRSWSLVTSWPADAAGDPRATLPPPAAVPPHHRPGALDRHPHLAAADVAALAVGRRADPRHQGRRHHGPRRRHPGVLGVRPRRPASGRSGCCRSTACVVLVGTYDRSGLLSFLAVFGLCLVLRPRDRIAVAADRASGSAACWSLAVTDVHVKMPGREREDLVRPAGRQPDAARSGRRRPATSTTPRNGGWSGGATSTDYTVKGKYFWTGKGSASTWPTTTATRSRRTAPCGTRTTAT